MKINSHFNINAEVKLKFLTFQLHFNKVNNISSQFTRDISYCNATSLLCGQIHTGSTSQTLHSQKKQVCNFSTLSSLASWKFLFFEQIILIVSCSIWSQIFFRHSWQLRRMTYIYFTTNLRLGRPQSGCTSQVLWNSYQRASNVFNAGVQLTSFINNRWPHFQQSPSSIRISILCSQL